MNKTKIPNVVRGGVAIPLGRNLYYMKGRKHSQGGIDIGKNPRTGLEVEDGEIIQMKPKELRVLSAQKGIGTGNISPAQAVLNGANPDKVFQAQENFKDRNKINDDGTKAENGKEKTYDAGTIANVTVTAPMTWKASQAIKKRKANKVANAVRQGTSDFINDPRTQFVTALLPLPGPVGDNTAALDDIARWTVPYVEKVAKPIRKVINKAKDKIDELRGYTLAEEIPNRGIEGYAIEGRNPNMLSLDSPRGEKTIITKASIPSNEESIILSDTTPSKAAENKEFLKTFNKWNKRYGYDPIPLDASKSTAETDRLVKERLLEHNTFTRGIRHPLDETGSIVNKLINEKAGKPIRDSDKLFFELVGAEYHPIYNDKYATRILKQESANRRKLRDTLKRKGIINDSMTPEQMRDIELDYMATHTVGRTGHGRAGANNKYNLYTSNSYDTSTGYAISNNTNEKLGRIYKLQRPLKFKGDRVNWVQEAEFTLKNNRDVYNPTYESIELPYLMRTGRSIKSDIIKGEGINYGKAYNEAINKEYDRLINSEEFIKAKNKYGLENYDFHYNNNKEKSIAINRMNDVIKLSNYNRKDGKEIYKLRSIFKRNKPYVPDFESYNKELQDIIENKLEEYAAKEGIIPQKNKIVNTTEHARTTSRNSKTEPYMHFIFGSDDKPKKVLDIIDKYNVNELDGINYGRAHQGRFTKGLSRKSKATGGLENIENNPNVLDKVVGGFIINAMMPFVDIKNTNKRDNYVENYVDFNEHGRRTGQLPYTETIKDIYKFENPDRKGIKGNKAYPYDSRTIGPGIDFKSGHPELAKKAKKGIPVQDINDSAVTHLRKDDEVIMSNYADIYGQASADTVSHGPRFLAAQARYQQGNIRKAFPEITKAMNKGDAEALKKAILKVTPKDHKYRRQLVQDYEVYPSKKSDGGMIQINGNVRNGLIYTPRPKQKCGGRRKAVSGTDASITSSTGKQTRAKFNPGGKKTITDVKTNKTPWQLWLESVGGDNAARDMAIHNLEKGNEMARKHADLREELGYDPSSNRAIVDPRVGEYQKEFQNYFWDANRKLYNSITPSGNSGDNQFGTFTDKNGGSWGQMTNVRTPYGIYGSEALDFYRYSGFIPENHKGDVVLEKMTPFDVPKIERFNIEGKTPDLSPISRTVVPKAQKRAALKGTIRDKFNEGPTLGDWIGAGVNLGASLGDFFGTNAYLNKFKSPDLRLQPHLKLKTYYNNNAEIDEINRNVENISRDIDANTASSSTALARKINARNNATMAKNKSWQNKFNIQDERINTERKLNSNIDGLNADRFNRWSIQDAAINNAKYQAKANNLGNLMGNISGTVNDVIARIEARRNFNNNLGYIQGANPNVDDRIYEDTGVQFDPRRRRYINTQKGITFMARCGKRIKLK